MGLEWSSSASVSSRSHPPAFFAEHDVFELELALMADPEAGDLIPGTKGLRKIRRPVAGRGKRGGARVIYDHLVSTHQILLL